MKYLFILCTVSILSACNKNTCVVKSDINEETACLTVYDPVCGCNTITYGNACEAKRAGVQTYVPGECN